MYLSKDKLFFSLKIASLFIFCLLFSYVAFAGNGNAPYFVTESTVAPSNALPTNDVIINAPNSGLFENNFPTNNAKYNFWYRNKKTNDYSGVDGQLLRYFDEEVKKSKLLNNYHEENYIFASGQHNTSYYDGILTNVIKDFDNDSMPEMAIFRIKTDSLDEISNKEISIEMIKMINDSAVKVDEMVLDTEQFIGEEIECSIAMKYVNDTWRIYLNYCDKKVREQQYENKFIAIQYIDAFNVLSQVNLSGGEDDFVDSFEHQDEIIDSGVDFRDTQDIHKRCFINDDMKMIPIFLIKRVNEKIRDGYIDAFFDQMGFEDENGDFRKVRYGYTQFLDRAHEVINKN